MLVVGIFAVLSWDSVFPNRRDVMVLAPLPVRARTMFLAKAAASATALGLTAVALHVLSGIAWPLALAPANGSLLDWILPPGIYRPLAAYWITMLGSGAFIFCALLCLQGVVAQLLPRRQFLRVSGFLQIAAFCFFLCGYFLEPALKLPQGLETAANRHLLEWLPTYWFLGLFQVLNGTAHSAPNIFASLAQRAAVGLTLVVMGGGFVFLFSYYRTLRKIVEEPDITPAMHGLHWAPRFGKSLETAIVQFSIRTLLRSRQHRVVLAFYLGLGFAIAILLGRAPVARELNVMLLVSSIVMMCLAAIGTRVVFAIPLELGANWIFRLAPLKGAQKCLAASRRALLIIGVAPMWTGWALVLVAKWPGRAAAEHLAVLALVGTIVAEIGLGNFRKIPFTCSYLPGKSYLHMAILGFAFLMLLINKGAQWERSALQDPARYSATIAVLLTVLIWARWRSKHGAGEMEGALEFEDVEQSVVAPLNLHHDGVTTLPSRPS
jgi:hypothetical protein